MTEWQTGEALLDGNAREVVLAESLTQLQSAGLDWPQRRRLLLGIHFLQGLRPGAADQPIPRLIHFIKTDPDPARLHAVNYLSIKSALLFCPGYRVILHTPVTPRGPLWDELLPHLELNLEAPPQSVNRQRLNLAAHQSDVWRVQKLLEHGGFYFDWDLVLLRSPEALRDNICVLGVEALVPNHAEVMGVAAIGAQPQSVFLRCWLNGMASRFNPDHYTGHSTVLAHELARQIPGTLRVLSSRSFYQPGWCETAMAWLFSSAQVLDASQLALWRRDVFGIHLFESHANFQRWAADLSLDDLMQRDCNLTRLLQPLMQASLGQARRREALSKRSAQPGTGCAT